LILQSIAFSGFGLLTGAALSIFFKRKVVMMGYGTGFGLGIAIHQNANGLINHICQKCDSK